MHKLLWFCLLMSFTLISYAAERFIYLDVGYKNVNFTGKNVLAIAVNNQIPAPTLHFREGDNVTILVRNYLNKETAIHWHGVLVPWQMDGVLGVSQQGIPARGSFEYRFTLHQSGTYWYHAHAGLQEQQGLYGAFIIDPIISPNYHYNKDYAVVLSDWSNTLPENILANLKKSGDYYSPRFPLQPSLLKFLHDYKYGSAEEKQLLINDYKTMQQSRMSIYDLSDVAFDAFLLNGRSTQAPWTEKVKVGDIVRLRFIGASANTIFHVKIPGTRMQIVHIDGNDVRPYLVDDFSIAPGETYDVLIKILQPQPYIIYAESNDKVGAAYGALITQPQQFVNYDAVTPFPEPPPVTREMNKYMHAMHMGSMAMNHMNMSTPMTHMSMPTEPTIIGDKKTTPTHAKTSPDTKYEPVIAAVKTNDPNRPIAASINMELFGYMDRFIWFINGVPEYKAHPIILDPNRRYRLVFTNNSMMHHPMHIHGHWFILRKGQGAFDPLLHTIDVPPGATITADIDTDASGQWFFHCHFLYHMMSGMSRVLQYSTLIDITQGEAEPQKIVHPTEFHNRPIIREDAVRPIDISLVKHPMGHPPGFWFANELDVGLDPFHQVQQLTYKGLYGTDYNKLELFTNDAEVKKGKVENADIDIFYWHLLSQYWAIKGGANYFYRPAQVPYWQPGMGIEGLLPYFIETDFRGYYKNGSTKLDLEFTRDTQISNNFFVRLEIRSILASKTIPRLELGSGLNQMRYTIRPFFRLLPGLDVFSEFEHDQDYGAFKRLQIKAGESTTENTLSFGLSALF